MKNCRSLALALVLSTTTAASQTVLHVDAQLTTGANDGSSWADAFQGALGLQGALAAAQPGDQVWVADGVYHPAPPGGARDAHFRLLNGVELYGGFQGGESDLDARPAPGLFPSVLSGDLNDDDGPGSLNQSDNSFQVVKKLTSVLDAAVLDGFEVTGGVASSGIGTNLGAGLYVLGDGPTVIRRCRFVDNQASFVGGGAYIGAKVEMVDCSFEGNFAGTQGGGAYVANLGQVHFDGCTFTDNRAGEGGGLHLFLPTSASVVNCFFRGNVATFASGGGAMDLLGDTIQVLNCTVVQNSASLGVEGGIRRRGATPQVVNCILWGNVGVGGGVASENQATPGLDLRHCLVMGGYAGGAGNISAAPDFVDPMNGDFSLAPGSAGIDAGDSTALPLFIERDLAGRTRIVDDPATPDTGIGGLFSAVVDMGAWEYQSGPVGDSYCSAVRNSTGRFATLTATGSDVASDDDLTLHALNVTPHQFGMLASSTTVDWIPLALGSQGTLCLGGPMGLYRNLITRSDALGAMSFPMDLTALQGPGGPTAATAGETWYFQVWYRDVLSIGVNVPVSNWTGALQVDFR